MRVIVGRSHDSADLLIGLPMWILKRNAYPFIEVITLSWCFGGVMT